MPLLTPHLVLQLFPFILNQVNFELVSMGTNILVKQKCNANLN